MSTKIYAHDKKGEQRAQKAIMQELARLGGKVHNDDDVTYEGTRIVLPTTMTIDRAIKFLAKKQLEMEAETVFHKTFNYRPWDGAYCMWNALKKVFGVVGHKGAVIETMFGKKEDPPRMITINTGVGVQEQVPWGRFVLPIMPDVAFQTGATNHAEYGQLFQVMAEGPKKYSAEIEGIWRLVEDELRTNSLYRGKAFDGQQMPEFVDLSGTDPEKVVYSREVMTQLEVNIWAQLRHTQAFEEQGIPLKRAVLVHGPYGTGKTLAAILTGQEATANGWTFIKGRPGRDDLATVMQTARLYQPAVVFYEDVDQITDVESSHENNISRLLDDFDGIDAKGTRILCVLTTNHAERIHKGMARPGRLDAMIEINELDLEGVTKLIKSRVGDLVVEGEIDWEAVFEASEGYKPAFVTEFADRAIRYALNRNEGKLEGIKLETSDILSAALGLRPQYELMSGARDRHEPPMLDVALREALHPTVVRAVRDNVEEEFLVEANGNS